MWSFDIKQFKLPKMKCFLSFLFLAVILVSCDSSSDNMDNPLNDHEITGICVDHNLNCDSMATSMGMSLEEFHQWQAKLGEAISHEDEMTDENGDIVDPNYHESNGSYNPNEGNANQGQLINCDKCHGSGTRMCSCCKGSRQRKCTECHGDGIANAMSGEYTCNNCHGTGIQTCDQCDGSGISGDCNRCQGRGQVILRN
jgi:DnaJ-class molecular chaperone